VTERLRRLLHDAAGGVFPPADGVVEVWPAPAGAVDAVLAFTAHHVVAAARHLTPSGEPLFAQVAPGNVASLGVVAAAGFRPVGAEVLFHRGDPDPI
jgi:hypothetical protein